MEREKERVLSAGFAAAVGHARTAHCGCRNDGSSEKDFGESGARTGKNLE